MTASRREWWLRNTLYGILTLLLGIFLVVRYVVDGVFEIKLTGVLCVMIIAWSLIIWLPRRAR
jgi:hypothetical protein